MIKFAIDLTWVRHNKVGGTESCIRNLLNGFQSIYTREYQIILLLATDNEKSFCSFAAPCFERVVCDVHSESQMERVIWQNTKLGKVLKLHGIDHLLEPIYSIPFFGMNGIKIVSTIHDLQAAHYPEYFSWARVCWMKLNWHHTAEKSARIIAISEYVKNDIIKELKVNPSRITTIYDVIDINPLECSADEELHKYSIQKGRYYYTVSSLLPHKNLITIIRAVAELKKKKSKQLYPLIISGVGGKAKEDLIEYSNQLGIGDYITLTSFVDNRERNLLYKNAKAFLFPSIFEGFGMPPIEAMAMGVPVLTTRCTSIPEVTGNLLNYVSAPLNPNEWVECLEGELQTPEPDQIQILLRMYDKQIIANEYLDLFAAL